MRHILRLLLRRADDGRFDARDMTQPPFDAHTTESITDHARRVIRLNREALEALEAPEDLAAAAVSAKVLR